MTAPGPDDQGLPDPPPAAPRPAGAPWPVVAAAVALAAVSLAVALTALLLGGGGDDDVDRARASALEAVRERTLALTSYDYRTLDRDVAGVLETATGTFARDYETTTSELRATFTSQQAVATAEVVAAGLEEAEQDRAVAVVAVDQVIRTLGAAPRTERNRLRMTVVRPDGTWLVERVERL